MELAISYLGRYFLLILTSIVLKTRITTFNKRKFKKSDDQTNIDKYRVAAYITEYHIISKVIFLRLIIPKFMMKRRLFHVKNVCKNVNNQIKGILFESLSSIG